ncbi:hypothetical protein C8A01DRAFT_48843 [Parachaetomium inaequale]|uniref:Uncharacterized protein n=1 Tax=Parachaetomium inaequale TaxID=2588326 RepID=A0AAN6PAM1_9PEZI|nr:hypothetical protein C8A01DRAFT_48843 [Parachaetomium inaequale]
MPAPQGLLLETTRAEADHAEAQHRIDELARHYGTQEQQALADLDEKSKAIDAQFEKQRADMVAQVEPSLRESIGTILSEKRDLEIAALRRTYQEKADERKKLYDQQKQQYDAELFRAMTALMTAGPGRSPHHQPAFPSLQPGASQAATPATVVSSQSTFAETAPAPPVATEVPSQLQPVALPTPALTETDRQPIPSQNDASDDTPTRSPRNLAAQSQDTPAVPSHLHSTTSIQRDAELTSSVQVPAQVPAERAASPASILGQKKSSPEPTTPARREAQPSVSAKPSPKPDSPHKRKADGESTHASPAASSRVKRAKLEKAKAVDKPDIDGPSTAVGQAASERTVSYEDVYGAPGKPALYKHVIVQFPQKTGDFYILRCDEHGVHFGEHPLRGAAKHLASAQHGNMNKEHRTAIRTLGHRVLDCTSELADQNNEQVVKAFKNGYKAFNANNLSQTKRAELGYAPLDTPNSQKAALHRKQMARITDPLPCRFYVTSGGDLKCPVLVLPWGDISAAGLMGTLADTGIFREATDDGKPLGPKLPKCYVYREARGRVVGIMGWAKGYENGGPLERKREFPVLCAESSDCRMWSVGWVKAAHLSALDFDDPSSQDISFVREARDYYLTRVQRQHGAYGTPTPRQPARPTNTATEDVEMKDAGDVQNDFDGDSDRDSISKAMSDSDNGAERADADSRRTSFSNRDEPQESAGAKSTTGPVPSAQLIAAQALNLQGPARGGSASRSARASLEPPSRAGSVSSTGGGHRRVFKIHAHSSNRHSTNPVHASPSMVLPERPVDGTLPPHSAPSQPQGDNILQDFPGPTAGPSRLDSQSPKPAGARRPLPSGPMRSGSPSRSALLSAVNAKLTQPLRDNRAGSAPVQLAPRTDPVAEEIRLSGSASAAPGPSRQATPQPAPQPAAAPPKPSSQVSPQPAVAPAPKLAPAPAPAPEPIQRREQLPPPIQLPPPPTTLPAILHLNTTPLATPTASAGNTRANSPVPTHTKTSTPTTASFPKPETPTLTPTLSQQPSGFLPTMDVFDLAGFMDGSTELFRSAAPGQYLRLIDDHQTGVFTTPSDAPLSLRIDPRRIKTAERAAAQGGAVCVVTIVYHSNGGEPGWTQTLVLEKARSTARGMENGMVHARRLCRRLQTWNAAIVCPSPGYSLDSVQWRFNSQTPTPTSAAVPVPVASTVGQGLK